MGGEGEGGEVKGQSSVCSDSVLIAQTEMSMFRVEGECLLRN